MLLTVLSAFLVVALFVGPLHARDVKLVGCVLLFDAESMDVMAGVVCQALLIVIVRQRLH